MKKIVSLLMVGLLFSFCACATNEASNTSTDSQQSSSEVDTGSSSTDTSSFEDDTNDSTIEDIYPDYSNQPDDYDDSSDIIDDGGVIPFENVRIYSDLKMQEYDINNVSCTIFYGIWEEWNHFMGSQDNDNANKVGCALYVFNNDIEYQARINSLADYIQNGNGPLANLMQIKDYWTMTEVYEKYTFHYTGAGAPVYAHSENITIPQELFTKDEGYVFISFSYYYFLDVATPQVRESQSCHYYVKYEKQGDKVRFLEYGYGGNYA